MMTGEAVLRPFHGTNRQNGGQGALFEDYKPAQNAWTTRLAKNPASMLLYALQGKINPAADSDIDWDSLKEFWVFCYDKGYACNAVQCDRERPAPAQLFSPRNTVDYPRSIVKADIPDEIVLEFVDETRGWAPNERSVYNTPDGLPAGTEKTRQVSSI